MPNESRAPIQCIFCLLEKLPSLEHVIPESVGGVLTVNYVCTDCNSALGSKADAELNKHRHIYDTYLRVKDQVKAKLKFHFTDSHLEYPDGTKVKATKSNVDRRIVPTKLENGGFILDEFSDEWIIDQIKRNGQELCLREFAIDQIIHRYKFFKLTATAGDRFYDRTTGIRVIFNADDLTPTNKMSVNTPTRFIAKACVEVAYIFGLQNEIVELDLLRQHARYGIQFDELNFKEAIHTEEPVPGHTLIFHKNEFSIQFFGNYAVGVEIHWKKGQNDRVLVNHLSDKKVYEGKIDGENVAYTNEPVEAQEW